MAFDWIRPAGELRALAGTAEYRQTVQGMRARVDFWQAHFEDDPAQKCGWMHNYVCPACAGFLRFDERQPLVHACPACGTVAENTRDVLEAWVYQKRQRIAASLRDAAVLYRMYARAEDLAYILRVVEYYAAHYVEFEEYGEHAGRGRIMGQSLDEAVWAVNVLQALLTAGFDGRSAQGRRWHHLLFLPIARLVAAQTGMIHNIPLWHATAAFAAGVFFGDERLVRATLGGELGLTQQITRGFTADGLWFENSSGYHTYAMTAATAMCGFARWAGMETELAGLFGRVAAAYAALPRLMFRDGTLTAFNDAGRAEGGGWLRSALELYLEGARVLAGTPGAEAIAALLQGQDARGARAAFLFGAPAKAAPAAAETGSVHLPHNCVGVLRAGGVEAFFKYGNLHRSHAHPDALQICLPGFSEDLGVTGYGSPFHRGWFTQTLAHSTFVVDGRSQRFDARGTGALSPDGQALHMQVEDAYPGVAARRDLAARDGTLTDRMEIVCDQAHTLDWVFHCAGEAVFSGELTDDALPETDGGYGYLTHVRRAAGPFSARFTRDGRTLRLAFDELPDGTALYVAESPDNPANRTRHTLLVRTRARRAVIGARYTVG